MRQNLHNIPLFDAFITAFITDFYRISHTIQKRWKKNNEKQSYRQETNFKTHREKLKTTIN